MKSPNKVVKCQSFQVKIIKVITLAARRAVHRVPNQTNQQKTQYRAASPQLDFIINVDLIALKIFSHVNEEKINCDFFLFPLTGIPEFPIGLPLPHNLPSHPSGLPSEFWPTNFSLHPHFNPALIPQGLIPHYKLPNFQTLLSQYMGLSNLNGFLGYPQNLSVHTPSQSSQISPHSSISPRENSPPAVITSSSVNNNNTSGGSTKAEPSDS